MGSQVGRMLGEISENEVSNARPMLSAIVVGVSGQPGPGFYGLAEDLDKFQEDTKESQLKFWEDEKRAVYDTWKIDLKND
jgi:hypothetical protein